MKKILIIPILFLLSACNDNSQMQYRWMVVHPDEALFYCPVIKHFPKWQTLTEKQVGNAIKILQKNNITCKSNIDQIKKFLNDAESGINSK